ncbi:translocation/assembly module TamB domain-containing protein [Desulfoferula mesophila]|uniref:Translocation and assembly module TamB C-terminal domain-containing protein n=1 Tax=Desulfoferula mesophila TaxID=3058419 RepID=A0AAU9EGJ5_9BACT|nr:hypothetical protein FAK_33740 [Desulfoferula mesophilus]
MAGSKSSYLVKGLLALGLILAVLLTAAWAVGRSEAFRTWLVGQIQTQVAQATGGQLHMGPLEGNLLFGAQANNLSFTHQGRQILGVERLELSYNLLSILGGRLRISSITLVRPRLSLPLPQLPEQQGGAGLALSIKELNVSQGSLEPGGELGALQGVSQIDLSGRLVLDARGLKARIRLYRSLLSVQDLAEPVLVSLEGTLASGRLKLARLMAASGPNQVEASGEMELKAPYRLRATLKAPRVVTTELPLPWPLPAPPSGPLALEATAAGSLRRLNLQALISQGPQALEMNGWLEPQGGALSLRGNFKQVALADWGLPQAPLRLNGGWSLRSPAWPDGEAPLELTLDLDRAAWQKLAAGPLKAQAKWQGEHIVVSELNLASSWGAIQARGRLGLPRGDGPVTLDAQADFKDLALPPESGLALPAGLAQARLGGRIKAQGPVDNLGLEVDLGASRVAPGLDIDSLQARARLQGGTARLEEAHLKSALATLDAKGQADPERVDLRYKLAVPDMAQLITRLVEAKLAPPLAVAGALEAKGRLKGPWSNPDLRVEMSLERLFTRHAQAQQVHLEANLKNLGPAPRGWAQMTASGWSSGEILLERAAVRAEFMEGKEVVLVQGEGPDTGINFKLTSPSLLKLPLRATISELWFKRGNLGRWEQEGRAGLLLGGEEIKVDGLKIRQGEERIKLDGQFMLAGKINAALELSGIRMNHVVGPNSGLPEKSRLEGKTTLSGTLEQPVIDIAGKVRHLELKNMEPMTAEFSARYLGEDITVEGRVNYGTRQVMEMSGGAGLKVSLRPPVWEPTGKGIRLKATGQDLPLGLAASMVPGIRDLKGQARLEMTVGGTFRQPTLAGWLTLKDGSLVVAATGQQVTKIDLDLELRGNRLSIKRAHAQSDGEVDIKGSLSMPFKDAGALELELTSENLLVVAGDYAQMDITSNIRLEGDFEHPVIQGRIGVSDIGVRVGLSSPAGIEDVVILKNGEKPPPLEARDKRFKLPPALDPLRAHLEVTLGRRAHITLDEGWLDATGGMLVTKEPGQPPIFGGLITITRGLILLSGRRFEVLGGNLNFANKNQPDPDLYAEARLQMGETTVFVEVSGTANNPVLSFNSLPPMSQADILSTIIFGRPSSELNKGQSKDLSANALALLGQAGQKEMARLFGSDMSPDVVTVHNTPSAGPSLEAGKYLNDSLYLRYRQNLGPDGGQNVGLEYRFTGYFSIESTLGNTRDDGVDLVFTKDFNFSEDDKKDAKPGPGKPAPGAEPQRETTPAEPVPAQAPSPAPAPAP